MESLHLHHAASRALRSCLLLRARIQTHQSTPTTRRCLSSTTTHRQSAPPTHPSNTARRSSAVPPSPGHVTQRFYPASNALDHLPRSYTPRGTMHLRPTASPFAVNEDPAALDAMYVSLFGRGGDVLLPSDLKWLAVTHKSFDHGWQGNNDRLAYMGKRIVDVQISLALVGMPRMRRWGESEDAAGGRAGAAGREAEGLMGGIDNLTAHAKSKVTDRRRLAALAQEKGVQGVMRWKPRKAHSLRSSGLDTVLAHTLYSIVGAVYLTRGGETTIQLVKERLLGPLGLRM